MAASPARGALGTEQLERLEHYAAELERWNAVHNLLGPREITRLRARHIDEALEAMDLVRPGIALDVGSGAGLPGIPLAIACPQARMTLVDSSGRKVRFLRHVVARLGIDGVRVEQERLESYRPPEPVVTMTVRALAPPERLGGWIRPLCDEGTRVLWFAGARDAQAGVPGFEVICRRPLASGAGMLVHLQVDR